MNQYDREWNQGYQDFVDGVQPFGCAEKSDAWNAGYATARQNMDDDVAVAEMECIADYDARQPR
jgi:hypothetical protein